MVNYQQKCEICKKYFVPDHQLQVKCKKCKPPYKKKRITPKKKIRTVEVLPKSKHLTPMDKLRKLRDIEKQMQELSARYYIIGKEAAAKLKGITIEKNKLDTERLKLLNVDRFDETQSDKYIGFNS